MNDFQSNSQHPTSKLIINAAIKEIEIHGSSRGVSLRQIAKRANCTHTNVYNYFTSLEDLLWEVLCHAIRKMIRYIKHSSDAFPGSEEYIISAITKYLDFALEHSALYRFIWLDYLTENPPSKVIQLFSSTRSKLTDLITSYTSNSLSPQKIRLISNILHSYIHGEVCKLINGRILEDFASRKVIIIHQVIQLLHLLIDQPE